MIKINKPGNAPAVLLDKGVAKAAKHCEEYAANPADYDNGKLQFNFSSTIYGDKTVKQALIKAQLKKCCFCESKVGDDGDVEHFRPKSASRQAPSKSLIRPGYYWLAYDWDNLLLACPACNQRQKRNYFPLENPGQRALSDKDDYKVEQPVFINPALEDPETLISFRQEIAYPVKGSKRAKQTIDLLGLNREIMAERRRDHLNLLRTLEDILLLEKGKPQTIESSATIAKAEQILADSKNDDALFAGMMRANSNV